MSRPQAPLPHTEGLWWVKSLLHQTFSKERYQENPEKQGVWGWGMGRGEEGRELFKGQARK